jgi:hypothetical protein
MTSTGNGAWARTPLLSPTEHTTLDIRFRWGERACVSVIDILRVTAPLGWVALSRCRLGGLHLPM